MNSFSKDMNKLYLDSKKELDLSYDAINLVDIDFKRFLLDFFYNDTNKNLFLTRIFYEGESSIKSFQEYIFKKCTVYFYNLFNIDDLSFRYDSSIPLSNIDIVLSDSIIASINIYYKSVILHESSFFEVIDEGILEKEKKIKELNKKYNHNLKNINDSKFNKFINKSKNKEIINNIEMISNELLYAEDELSELLITRNIIERNMVNIKYFQDKISNRITRDLKYNVMVK